MFDARCHLYKKSRNPCIGELTARDDADFLIPLEGTLNKLSQEEAYKEYERTRAVNTLNTSSVDKYHTRAINSKDVTLLQSMRKQRSNIDKELRQLKLIGGLTNMEISARPF
ncbi:hypothetical protein EON65_26750 [archaeon]|nr:MAG: hypothetical protein EON65_26750 [archaeon]